jgi:hypothetical protein
MKEFQKFQNFYKWIPPRKGQKNRRGL